MSTDIKTQTNQGWHGEDVTMREVLDALGQIRGKFALQEAGPDEQPHPRSCVMTLVVVAPSDDDERLGQRVVQIIGKQHPALAVVIREEAPVRGRHLDAWITTEIQRSAMASAMQ
jgi:hypothetical protein